MLTNQVADYLMYDDSKWELLGDSSQQLPLLDKYGFQPVPMGTACYRGYIAQYAIIDHYLYLTKLVVLDRYGRYPEIDGVKTASTIGIYENLREWMPINGYLVIAKDLATLSQGDFCAVHDYSVVLRLKFQSGRLVSVNDLSEMAKSLRTEIESIHHEPGFPFRVTPENQHTLSELYAQSFDLTVSKDIPE